MFLRGGAMDVLQGKMEGYKELIKRLEQGESPATALEFEAHRFDKVNNTQKVLKISTWNLFRESWLLSNH